MSTRYFISRHCVIVGGIDMVEQGTRLSKKSYIVVTTGRLAEHLESSNIFDCQNETICIFGQLLLTLWKNSKIKNELFFY